MQQKYFQPKTVPSYFSFGDRYFSVLHARLRNKCSSLNSDLSKLNLVPSASCSCGYKNECSEHFLLYRNKFNLLRNKMLIELNMLDMGGSTGKYRYFVIYFKASLKQLFPCNIKTVCFFTTVDHGWFLEHEWKKQTESQFCICVKTLKTLLKRKIDGPQVIGRLAMFFQERVMIIYEHRMVNVK